MGAATAVYCASCCALGKYGNGNPYPAKISTVVGLSGWLPCSKFGYFHYVLSYLNWWGLGAEITSSFLQQDLEKQVRRGK